MPKQKKIFCPYYVTHSRKEKKYATITCANLETHLGFDVKNQVVFKNFEEQRNYIGVFCADLCEACPYYQSIYKREERENEKRKFETSRGTR